VSNYLNQPKLLSAATGERVRRAIQSLNFVRHAGAALVGGQLARTIGLVLLDVRNPFFTDVARGAEDAARETGHLVFLCSSDDDPRQEQRYLESLKEQRVLGVLISPINERASNLLKLRHSGMKIVLMGRTSPHYCCVVGDHEAGGEMAMDHLLDLGHRQVAFVTGSLSWTQFPLRLKGAYRALKRRRLPLSCLRVVEIPGMGSIQEGRSAVPQVLAIEPRPTAIFCANDIFALGVLSGLIRTGIKVPAEMSVVGYDDIELADLGPLGLTTIRQQKQELGHIATRLLLNEVDDADHRHQRIVLRPTLIVRETTGWSCTRTVSTRGQSFPVSGATPQSDDDDHPAIHLALPLNRTLS
jgi:LacI family transcriptional regulator